MLATIVDAKLRITILFTASQDVFDNHFNRLGGILRQLKRGARIVRFAGMGLRLPKHRSRHQQDCSDDECHETSSRQANARTGNGNAQHTTHSRSKLTGPASFRGQRRHASGVQPLRVATNFRESDQRFRIVTAFAAPTNCQVIAAMFPFDTDAVAHPPNSGMEEQHRFDHSLQQVYPVIITTDVSQFVQQQRFNLFGR